MIRTFAHLSISAAFAATLSMMPCHALAQTNPKPFVIPELTSWQGSEGNFTPSGRVVITSKSLRPLAERFADYYEKMFSTKLVIATGKAATGDFVIREVKDKNLGEEGYKLKINETAELTAASQRGFVWGISTIMQMLEQSNASVMPKGETTDVPQYAMRGMLFDVARKYFPMSYLRDLVRTMSYYKMNTLQVHLNDNGFKQYFGNDWNKTSAAFRLESDTFPGLTPKGASYTKQEFIDFQIFADSLGVEIIPEIDVPAHCLPFVHYKPEIGSEEYGADHLDLFKDETYKFIDALFAEYLGGKNPVFRGKRVNIGTDEYSNAKEEMREKFRYFTDRYIKYVKSFGKQASLWGSLSHAYGKTPVDSKDVLMMCWYNGYADPKEMKKEGFQLVSIPDGSVYIVPAAGYYYDYLNTKMLYDKWTPAVIGNATFEPRDPSIEGGMFAVWNDLYGNGISVKDVHHRVVPAIQIIALKTWTAHATSVPYAEYEAKRELLSEAPGVNELARVGSPNSEVLYLAKVEPGEDLAIKEIGYNYTVTFSVDAAPETKGTVLFRSPNAVMYLSDPETGKLGFERDGYLNTFRYTLPEEGKVTLTITGDNKSTALYVNGKHQETLGAITLYGITPDLKFADHMTSASPDAARINVYRSDKKMYYQRTLVFPLNKAGNFKSKISELHVKNHISK